MTIKAFIIDDEAPARKELAYLLKQMEEVEVVGEATNGTSGLKGIRETKPDLIFLDIQMPGLNGLELSELLCDMPDRPLIIFATAYEEYAINAFDVEALDYILKPFTIERVKKTIMRVTKVLEEGAVKAESKKKASDIQKIPLYKNGVIFPTSPQKIIFAICNGGEVYIQVMDGRYRTKFTLSELEITLSPYGFLRVHRNSLVNLNYVSQVIRWFNGSYKLIMNDKERTEILVSRYNAKDLKRYFNL
jgi:DNA-binding LytR/AlgR family response regulator